MKIFIAALFLAGVLTLAGCGTVQPKAVLKQTYSSFDLPSEHSLGDAMPAGAINFRSVPLNQVLEIYAQLSARTVLHGRLPDVAISVGNATPLNRIEALQMLDTALAQNGIAMVLSGDKAVKAVSVSQAIGEGPPEIDLPWRLLPDSSSVMTRTVHLKNLKPSECVSVLAPFSKLPNSLIAIDGEQLLVLRDYSSSIRQQLKLLDELDQKKKF